MPVDRAREDPQHRRRRPPRGREDLARRGHAVPGGEDQPARHDRGRARRPPTGTTTSTSGRCRSRARCSISTGRTGRSTSSTARAIAGFQADTFAALRVVEGALVVMSGVMGVEVNTSRVWARAEEYELSRVIVRQHARPRARRLLPRARGRARAALRPLRRDPAADRRRARADRRRRPAAHVRVHGSVAAAKEGGPQPIPDDDGRRRCRSTARSCSTRSSRRTRT